MQDHHLADLSVEICGVDFKNPLILGSGGLGENADTLIPYLEKGAAAVVTRTTRLRVDPGRIVFPSPHLFIERTRQYVLNAEWGNLTPWEYWVQQGIPALKDQGIVILSVSGRNIPECVSLAQELDKLSLPMIEVNVSCSHSGLLYGRITDDAFHVRRLISQLKRQVKTPIVLKLGWSPILPDIAQVAERAGVDAIATTNSIGPGLDIRLEDGRPQLGIQGGAGGVTGKAIFPIALQCVHSVVEAVNVPVIGIGGISSYREVLKMLMVGAQGVQIYSEAFLRGPDLFATILRDLSNYMVQHNVRGLNDLRGVSRTFLNEKSNLTPLIPEVIPSQCTACDVCRTVCTVDAIKVTTTAEIDPTRCIGCGACVHVCPPRFGAIIWPPQHLP